MNKLSSLFQVSLCSLGYFLINADHSIAQVTPDNTVNTQVNQNSNVAEVTGGNTQGNNLFHSFQDFSVPTGNEAFFNNAGTISNIFSRVTGGNISNINGAIRANGSANLFLINPAGIIFGENARLDIGGSFLGSTSNSILFPDDIEFSATDTQVDPILTINAPIGLGFRDEPEEITNRSGFSELENGDTLENGGLVVNEGEFITLAGGNINLENGRLTAPGGRIELGGLAAAGIIQLNRDLGLNFTEDVARSNVSLTGIAELDVTSGGGGDINIFAQNIDILEGSDICAGIGADGACGSRNENFGSVDAIAGNITFNAIDTITIDGGISDVNNNVNSNSIGNSGNINIQTGSLFVTNGGRISNTTDGIGDAGTISISASNRVFIADSENGSFVRNNINSNGLGNSRGININTNSLSVNNGAQIQSRVLGEGDSGKITIIADSIEFSGRDMDDFPSGVFSLVEPGGVGNAGGIDITSNTLLMSDRAQLLSNTEGIGDGEDINLQITNESNILNSSIIAEVTEPTDETAGGFGNGGDINITTSSLLLQNGSSLLADTENEGDAGNIDINTNNLVLEGEGLSSKVGARESEIVPSQISSTVQARAIGDGGSIAISSSSISVRENAFISVTSEGDGMAGIVNIEAGEIELEDRGNILAETLFGEGGNIVLNVDNNLLLRDNSLISAQAFNDANGGNVSIDANFIIAFPNQTSGNGNDIIASAASGNGGNISINTESILGIKERNAVDNNRTNDLDASSDFGLDGNISIFTPDINPIQGATELPINVVETGEVITQACNSDRSTTARNSLTVIGKGGIAPSPDLPLNSANIIIDDRINNSTSTIPQPIETSQGKIQPARGVRVTDSGEIILTAYRTDNAGNRIIETKANCGI